MRHTFRQIRVLNGIVNMHFLLLIYLCQWLEDKIIFFYLQGCS